MTGRRPAAQCRWVWLAYRKGFLIGAEKAIDPRREGAAKARVQFEYLNSTVINLVVEAARAVLESNKKKYGFK